MHSSCVMFVAAVCILFLVKLKWPKNKSIYDVKYCYPAEGGGGGGGGGMYFVFLVST